jgi:hypothetical protein
MLDGFNESWIDFQGASIKGSIEFESVIRGLLAVCVIVFLVAEKQRTPVPHISFGDRLQIARCLSAISCFNAIPQRTERAGMNASPFPFMLPSRGRREKPYARFPQRIPGCSDA